MATDRKDPHERAKRLARLIIGEIVLYNQEKIAEAIRRDALFEAVATELEEGRNYYQKNVDPSVGSGVDYFDQAVVDVLVRGQAGVKSKIW
jgi:hypothetical protein